MVWDGATTVHDNWGTRPSLLQAQRINCVFRGADSVRIFPLDSLGRAGLFSTFQKGGDGTIPILIDQRNQGTPWFGIERFLSPAVHIEESPIPGEFEISLYPRPAGNFVNISLKSTTGREYTLEIRTILGKLVKFARILAESEVSRFIQLKINDLTPGTYFLSVKTDSRSKPKSIPLVKF
jgi:hypothetical protein